MIIREYQDVDQSAVIALWNECGLLAAQNDPVQDIQSKCRVGRDLFLVGEQNGQLVATAMGGYEGHRGWVNYLAVDPALQRSGLGRELMTSLENKLRQKGCPKINLQVRTSNQQTIDFYHAIGFLDDDVVSLGKRLD